jgi:2-haloalkanoic acid dehalogenase type II
VALKAIVFDAYETLCLNSPSFWHESFLELSNDQNLGIDPMVLWERWFTLEREFRRRRLDTSSMTPRIPFESYAEAWTGCFSRVFEELGLNGDPVAATEICIRDLGRRPLYPDTKPALMALVGQVQLAVLSNADSSYLYPLLEYHGLMGFFQAVICSEEAVSYKPHRGIFDGILAKLGVEPHEAIQVGDTLKEDVWGAKLVGMGAIWLNRSGGDLQEAQVEPDFQIQDLREISDVMDRHALS